MNGRLLISTAALTAVILLPYLAPIFSASRCILAGGVVMGGMFLMVHQGGALTRMSVVFGRASGGTRWMVACLIVFLVARLVRDSADLMNYEPRNVVAIDLLFQCLLIGTCLALALEFLVNETVDMFYVVTAAISCYAAVNLIGYSLGIQAQSAASAESLSGRVEGRLVAPFGPGLNNFGMIIAVGLGMAAGQLGDAIRSRSRTQILGLSGFAGIGVLTLFLVEMRSTLLNLGFGVFWAFLRGGKTRAITGLAACMVMFLLPIVSLDDRLGNALANFAPEPVFNLMQRSSSDLRTVGGRTYIWSYGLEVLLSGNSGAFGLGPRTRDTRDLLDEYLGIRTESNSSYHNSVIDTLVVYGVVLGSLGLLVVLGLSLALARRCWRYGDSARGRPIHAALLMQSSLCLAGVSEAFSSQVLFWAFGFLCLGVLGWDEARNRRGYAVRARFATAPSAVVFRHGAPSWPEGAPQGGRDRGKIPGADRREGWV